jgi:hypothetical protein
MISGSPFFLLIFYLSAAGAFLLPYAIWGVACLVMLRSFRRIPAPFRRLDPTLVWLLLIPGVALVWSYFVLPKLARSFKAYFDYVGDRRVGDCGEGLGLAFSVCYSVSSVCLCVPYCGVFFWVPTMALLILFVARVHQLKYRIPADAETWLEMGVCGMGVPPMELARSSPETQNP